MCIQLHTIYMYVAVIVFNQLFTVLAVLDES